MSFSAKPHVQLLIGLLRDYNIQHLVVCPGSRNSPIIETAYELQAFHLHSVVDERSAGYVALGLSEVLNQPVAVCCTSGTALHNLGSSIAEAYFRRIPLLVISADRPSRELFQLDGQTIPQTNIFRRITLHSLDVEETYNDDDLGALARDLSMALLSLSQLPKGPVHINIHIQDPVHESGDWLYQTGRRVRRVGRSINPRFEEVNWESLPRKRVMLLLGQEGFDPNTSLAIRRLKSLGCVVLAEHTANLKPEDDVIKFFDTILYVTDKKEFPSLAPDLLITAGGHIISKRIKQLLRQYKPCEHWHVGIDSSTPIPDPYLSLTHIFDVDLPTFAISLEQYLRENSIPSLGSEEYLQKWEGLQLQVPMPPINNIKNGLSAIGLFLSRCKAGNHLLLGNSSIIRLAQLYPLPFFCHIYANRGTSGIDGLLSTAVGIALGTAEEVWAIVGDLSAFYDMNILRHDLPSNLRIIVLNNGGGGIFFQLPSLQDKSSLKQYIGASHSCSMQGWAEEAGLDYFQPQTAQQFLKALDRKHPTKASLIEIFTDIRKDTEAIQDYRAHVFDALKQTKS
ncbi:hypothetical protein HQ45_02880 [Porphyromonas crevioricanis]|uniref:2-succinyl-5-enolpyruvyl-6-hydroxy-3- cyclohexene-1-carboxylic-acid synthase n=1 Tax=Porphyromonas crevioricanis TaxID=393921 RepID=UPI00052CD19B|nr:2-succinyl-5-enolpyruvyl-6-hydroxy-3-cyclohexene-1-carboxylic-acid synthase [Porphyromonas crevioricanis]KGN91061.1 hypothetical protein HQ45_02880 [Porphyromonas crevioricanis]